MTLYEEREALLAATAKAQTALTEYLLLTKRCKHETIDESMQKQACAFISQFRQYRHNVLVPNSSAEDAKDGYIHPFCKSFHTEGEG